MSQTGRIIFEQNERYMRVILENQIYIMAAITVLMENDEIRKSLHERTNKIRKLLRDSE